MKNFLCKKCDTLIQSERTPNLSGCIKGTFHQWYDFGEVGTDTYKCKNCGLVLKSKKTPTLSYCIKGTFHQWHKIN
jgi:hypothetical protein